MAATVVETVTLATLVELFRGVLDDRGDWLVTPSRHTRLVEAICARIGPIDRFALLRAVCNDGAEVGEVTRDAVGPEAWDALVVGYDTWVEAGRPRL